MDLFERIKNLSQEQGFNIKALEQQIGFGNGTIRRWGTNIPSADKLLKVANLLNTTCEYLLTGKTSTDTFSPEDAEWLSLIHQLPEEKRYEFKGELKGYLRRLNEESVAADSNSNSSGKSLA